MYDTEDPFFGVVLIFSPGPEHLTRSEAERMARYCYAHHEHSAARPQPSIYWLRVPEDFSA